MSETMPGPSGKNGPLVSVLIATFNRRQYLPMALASALGQTYRNLEVILVNDGGEDVRDIVAEFADPRLTFLDRRDNRGVAFSFNQALGRAKGKYVAYLGDDDLFYPHHVARLVEFLEGPTDCGVAYTDLYKVHCRVLPDGSRQVLGKVVNISRDFDRFFLCYFNLALHVALMHRRDLLEKTGPYNEEVKVLVDWDMTRRLGFYADFHHLAEVTGEFWAPVGRCDRISYRERLDSQSYLSNTLMIRTARPPKPWPKMPDLSIFYLPDRADPAVAKGVPQIYAWTFMPYEIYVPLPAADLARLDVRVPNFRTVATADGAALEARVDAALRAAAGDYVAVVPPEVAFGPLWVEDALHAAVHDPKGRTAFAIRGSTDARPAFVLRREKLLRARQVAPHLPLAQSLRQAGIDLREPLVKEGALQFDRLYQDAEAMEQEGNWARAAWLFKEIPQRFDNKIWMQRRAAHALYQAGNRDGEALETCRRLNRERPIVDTLLLEARLHKRADRFQDAVDLLEQAERILIGKG